MGIEFYKEQFEKLGKSDIFELNKPFIEEICALKEKILKIRAHVGDNVILVHPQHPNRVKVPDAEIWLMKLEDQYKNMIVALNRIIGSTDMGEEDPLEDWINAHRSQSTERDN